MLALQKVRQVPLNAGFNQWMHLRRFWQKGVPGCNQLR